MENFKNLPEQKQEIIRNAALAIFGARGYRKASMNDIAAEAGISKALLFHYFGTKKALYLYLIEYCGDRIVEEIKAVDRIKTLDFFQKLELATDIKIETLKKSPYILSFINSMRAESDREIVQELKQRALQGGSGHSGIFFSEEDSSRFKAGIESPLILNMLKWMAEGLINEMPTHSHADMDRLSLEFKCALKIMKSNFYKEEYQ